MDARPASIVHGPVAGPPCYSRTVTFAERLDALCRERRSHVCIGLDPQLDRLPASVQGEADPIFAFNRAIVDATIDVTPVYKPNLAFYEAQGLEGWTSLKRTVDYIGGRAIVLGDAKRGDIENTQTAYARAMFDVLGFDACTVSVYQGFDAAGPFLKYADRGVFVLCRTSNRSGDELQNLAADGKPLYEHVAELARDWNANGNCGLVVGATYPAELGAIRTIAPGLPILIPGVGAQGGDVEASARNAAGGPFVMNSSRGIIYASSGDDFAEAARRATLQLRDQIASIGALAG
jgi:orotidine-5'-phosphate decarboxylase